MAGDLTPVDPDPALCPARYVGPTGVVWRCFLAVHEDPDPTAGYAGTGHDFRAVPRL